MKRLGLRDVLLLIGWVAALGVAAAALILLGFAGYLMILVWSAAAAPLSLLSVRRLAKRRLTLDPGCRRLALRSYAWLVVATMTVPLALWASTSLESEGVGIAVGYGLTIVFVGQIGYVLAATYWMVRELVSRLDERPLAAELKG